LGVTNKIFIRANNVSNKSCSELYKVHKLKN
jgi:hypothetical protein